MSYDYNKLRGKIREVFGTQEEFAKAMNMSNTTLSFRLNNQREWTQQEITKALEVLGVDTKEMAIYFFTIEV